MLPESVRRRRAAGVLRIGDRSTLTAEAGSQAAAAAQVQVTVDGLKPLRLQLTEFMANNGGSLTDGDGNESDWIEIYNPNLYPVDLEGYRLTDDAALPAKWQFPAGAIIGAGEHHVVFASAQSAAEYQDGGGAWHTTFALDRSGSYLAFSDPSGASLGSSRIIRLNLKTCPSAKAATLPSRRRAPQWGDVFSGFVADTKFNIDRGIYDSPISLRITSATEGAAISHSTAPSQRRATAQHLQRSVRDRRDPRGARRRV
ncbi:MAG: lamin tail domain-containing protein [Verrucomicrobiales bacterium]